MRLPTERVAVERLKVGDRVKAVEHGPVGVVADVALPYGWTSVEWSPGIALPYKHGKDHLYVVEEVMP